LGPFFTGILFPEGRFGAKLSQGFFGGQVLAQNLTLGPLKKGFLGQGGEHNRVGRCFGGIFPTFWRRDCCVLSGKGG